MNYLHGVSEEHAETFWKWIKERGGLAVWQSVNLANPFASWTTPVKQENGEAYTKPTWEADSSPRLIVTDPAQVEVLGRIFVRSIRVGIERGTGLSWNLTKAASGRLNAALDQLGSTASYEFDFDESDRRIARLYKADSKGPLAAWAASHNWT